MSTQSSRNKLLPLRSLALLLSMLVAQNGWACYKPPEHQLIGVDEQIAGATDVSVAEVISATPIEGRGVEYRFRVQQRLTGYDRAVFTVNGRAAGTDRDTSFDNHTDPAFWQRGGGRTMNVEDCRIYPSFVVGASYLVFLGSPVTWRSFEKIDTAPGAITSSDKWLAYVKAGLRKRS